jgi:hypothetical protein
MLLRLTPGKHAKMIAFAATSGSYTLPIGLALLGSLFLTHPNWVVFMAGNCIMVSFTSLLSCANSQRNESKNP